MRYRKKPVEIEAYHFTWGDDGKLLAHPDWLGDAFVKGAAWFQGGDAPYITIASAHGHGELRCNVGDWIIRGVEGELYPCIDRVFRETYEAI